VRLDPARAGEDRQNLADALRDLRKASGLSGDRLARRCGMSQSKVSRIETGRLLPSVVDVDRMLHALGVDPATCAELLALARVANAEYQDVRASVRRGLHHRQRELSALEADASEMYHFLPALITGLLQHIQSGYGRPFWEAAGLLSRSGRLTSPGQPPSLGNCLRNSSHRAGEPCHRGSRAQGRSELCSSIERLRPARRQ